MRTRKMQTRMTKKKSLDKTTKKMRSQTISRKLRRKKMSLLKMTN